MILLPPPPVVQISIDAAKPTVEVPRELFGVFFEEINHAGEGGVDGELLRNRSLAGWNSGQGGLPEGWRVGDLRNEGLASPPPSTTVDFPTDGPSGDSQRHTIRITRQGAPVALVNEGFWGIPLKKGERYRLTLWARSGAPIRVALANGSSRTFPVAQNWKRFQATLTAPGTDSKSHLELSSLSTLQIAHVSLVPEKTWKGHGLRPDLAERVAALKPGFFRFPGGCYIEGQSLAQAWDWKRTLGPRETRPGMEKTFWGYPASDGLGFHEYLQFCEDLGAKAMYVANVGLSHSDMATLDGTGERSMQRYVQDALDAIEYANGPVTSKWGVMRAKAGHSKPFGLKYLEIGNENGYSWSFGGPAAYAPRFRRMHDAVKAKYPEIVTIANQPIADARPQDYDLLSEHYYMTPGWFWQNANRYDRYDRKGPKIYVGEYAVTQGSGRGNLAGALGEAAYMTGMERNADIVRMASYAPLLENVNARQWNPNTIIFNNHQSYGTPSYWVQALFAQNRISRVLSSIVVAPSPAPMLASGNIGLMTWNTQAEFKDLKLQIDGSFRGSNRPPLATGDWKAENGTYIQSGPGENRQYILVGREYRDAHKVTYSVKARKTGGREGFILLFGGTNDADRLAWNLGGWNNTRHAFQLGGAIVEPAIENLTDPQKIETGRWYDIRLEREGDHVRGYLDGKLLQEATLPATPDLATIAGRAKNGDLLLRVVNGSAEPRDAEINLAGFRPRGGTATVLTGTLEAENSFDKPENVAPRVIPLAKVGARFLYRMPPHSLSILRLKR